MVTIWAMFQLLGVKVVGEELISPSGKAMVSATLAVGASFEHETARSANVDWCEVDIVDNRAFSQVAGALSNG